MLLIYIDCRERYYFYRRLAPGLAELGHRVSFVTPLLSVAHLFRRDQKAGRLANGSLTLATTRSVTSARLPDLSRSREIIAGSLNVRRANRLGAAIRAAFDRVQSTAADPLVGLWLWNGTDIAGWVARDFAASHALPTLFLEIANLPGKLFADPAGTNAQSTLATDATMLDALPVDLDAFKVWRQDYIDRKLASHTVPQARSVGRFSLLYGLDLAGHWRGLPKTQNRSALALLAGVYHRHALTMPADHTSPPNEPFVLFPMQVSNDSQLLLNSDIDNEQAVTQAADLAATHGMKLLVKPHPAEKDAAFLTRFMAMQKALGFEFAAGNTFQYLAAAAQVMVINSTVGFESMILHRPTTFVGRSFYPALHNDQRMAAYLQHFLIDIDYFDDAAIAAAGITRLLDRMGRSD